MNRFTLFCFLVLLACQSDGTSVDNTTEVDTVLNEISEPEAPNPIEPQNPNGEIPKGWDVSLDDSQEKPIIYSNPDSTDGIFFVNMTPGWHITTGPAAIFSHPALTASEDYSIETAIHLFDPGQRKESFGVFFGGNKLGQDDVSYDYFLIRQGGEFLVKRRQGSETSVIVPWTKHEAIMSFSEKSQASELNTLKVKVTQDSVHFFANENVLASLASDVLNTNGFAGLRVNHALNLHISDFRISKDD